MIGARWLSTGPGSGYGDASEAYMTGLRAAGVPVSWTPLGWPSPAWGAAYGPVSAADIEHLGHGDIANLAIAHDRVVVCSTPLWHERLAREADGRLLVAYTTWETDLLPREYVEILNRYDRVLVPSQFNARVFRSSGVATALRVVPHIARPRAAPRRQAGTFVFYIVATWTTRKAILDAVSAYLAAFTVTDDVRLVIHTTAEDLIAQARVAADGVPVGRFQAATWFTLARALAGRSDAPEIRLSTNRLTAAQMDALHAGSDCFLSLSRGEGWGLGAFDAASAGNPVIVTGWGGTLDFLPPGYPYLVAHDLVPTIGEAPDAWWRPRAGERWARAQTEDAARLLRRVFDDRDEATYWGRILREHVRATYSSENVVPLLIDALAANTTAV